MRHRCYRYKLSVKQSHRKLIIRNLIISLFRYERIITTLQRAKLAQRFAEKLITLAKKGYSMARYQRAFAKLQNKSIIWKLFRDIAPRFLAREGGYTRILKLGGSRWTSKNGESHFSYNTLKNNATRVILELVEKRREGKKKSKEEKTATFPQQVKQESAK
ncbi:MAG: 50S ribosomal protein L17 [Planctomycetota bacterium]